MTPKSLLVALLMSIPALAGCLGSDDTTTLSTEDEAIKVQGTGYGYEENAAPVIESLHNVSEPIPGITVVGATLEHYRIPMRDDVALDAWIVHPEVGEKVPLVLEVTPYYAGGSPISAAGTHAFGRVGSELVPRGYAYGIISVRGTGNSEGCFTQGGPTEALDTAEAVEFLASRSWSNGNVGIIGVSYPGTTPQDVWVEAPPSLKTIVPIAGISDMYKYNFVNGVHINVQGFGFNTYYWALVGAIPFPAGASGGAPDPEGFARAVLGEACFDQALVQEGGVSSTVDGNKDAYWLVRDFHAELLADWDKERASVFYIHGFQDWNVKPHMMEDWLPAIQRTGVDFKIMLGQWTHNWPQRSDWWSQPEISRDANGRLWDSIMVAWFDYYLKEIDTGILDMPAVQVQDDDGVWRHEANWPPKDVEWAELYPQADGTLTPNGPGAGEAGYHDYMGSLADVGAMDFGPDRVVFVTEPLEQDLTISGLPYFEGTVTASGKRASLMLTLAERLPDGTDRAINFAAQSLNHVQDLTQGRTDIGGMQQEVGVDFFPQDDVIHAGSRIVLIAAGNLVSPNDPSPALQPVSDGSMITMDLATVKFWLPVDGSRHVEKPQPCWDADLKFEDCYLVR